MKTQIKTLASVFALALLLVACKKNESVPVQFLLTDNPASYDAVNIHIKGMQVKISEDDSSWHTIQTKDTTVNLLDLQNGVTKVIAQDNVPEGILKEVRFILGSDNTVVVNGVSQPLETPSAEESGLKIKIGKQLAETMNTFVLDFDAALSVKEENGNYKLMPVIKLK